MFRIPSAREVVALFSSAKTVADHQKEAGTAARIASKLEALLS